jgi:hypothetical protein
VRNLSPAKTGTGAARALLHSDDVMGDQDDDLGIEDTSGLNDADWLQINKLHDAYRTGGQKALEDAWRRLKDDPIRTMRIYGAFFPDKLRNTIKDVMAAEGMTFEDLKDIIKKAKSAAH